MCTSACSDRVHGVREERVHRLGVLRRVERTTAGETKVHGGRGGVPQVAERLPVRLHLGRMVTGSVVADAKVFRGRHLLHIHHHLWGWRLVQVGRLDERRSLRHLLSHGHIVVVLGHLDVVRDSVGVPPSGGKLVVVGAVRLEHLHDVKVLSLVRHGHRGAVQVIEESRVGKHVEQVLSALCSSFSARQKQGSLAL